MKNKKYSKKSQSGIIVVILLILICIAAIFILWRLVFPISQNASEEAKIRQELTSTKIGINGVTGDLANPEGQLTIELSRGSEPIKLKNITYVPRTVTTTTGYIPNVSIVSAIDISDSMGNDDVGECKIDKLNTCCTTPGNDCSIKLGCETCKGFFINNECYLYSTTRGCGTDQGCINRRTCCMDKDCFEKAICQDCGGNWVQDDINHNPCKILSCLYTRDNCVNTCKGLWRSKLNITQQANNQFINSVFSKNLDNDMAVVGYADTVRLHSTKFGSYCKPDDCKSLTNNDASLKNKVNSYKTILGTNGCQGLNKSIYILNTSKNDLKFIILMSDGLMNIFCPGDEIVADWRFPDVKDQTVAQAVIANKSNITIYTIGFGRNVDEETLKKIANATTKGAYYFADVSQLDVVYDQILEEINTKIEDEEVKYYEPVNKYDFIRVIIYNETDSYKYDSKDMPNPLETKDIIIETGGMTNINKIEIYLVVKTENGKEISELVATWTPGNEENPDYLPSY